MNITNCPDCGGMHFGSHECPLVQGYTYTVGKRAWAYADTLDGAKRLREKDGKHRLKIYRWKLVRFDNHTRISSPEIVG